MFLIVLISIISIMPIFIAIYYLIVESKNNYWEKPEDDNNLKLESKEEGAEEEEEGFKEKDINRNIKIIPFGENILLPRNVMIKIFENLGVREYGRCLRVCNKWNSFLNFDKVGDEVRILFYIQKK